MKFRLAIFLFLIGGCVFAQENPLSTGRWLKFSISETGVYRISASDLEALGPIPANELRILGLPGGPLPQLIGPGPPPLISEIPVQISEDGDGIFNGGDYVQFFAEGPDEFRYADENINYTFNWYDRSNYIYAGYNGASGKRIEARQPVPEGGAVISTYIDIKSHETTGTNLLSSGRKWYGEKFGDVNQRQFSFSFPNALLQGTLEVTSKVMAQSFGSTAFSISVNGTDAGEQPLDPIPDFMDPPSNNPFLFSVKGRERTDTFSATITSEEVVVSVEFEPAPVTLSNGYLDYLIVSAESELRFTGEQEIYEGPGFASDLSYTARIESVQDVMIWNVSDLFTPTEVADITMEGDRIYFNDVGEKGKRYIAFSENSVLTAEFVEEVDAPDILSGSPELLIISPPEFLPAANRLASHRSASGIPSKVVQTKDVFDLFGSGRKDPTAIRNLVRWHYESNGLKYLLLMGKASFDYLDVLPFKSNFVPTYESRVSLDPLATFASDDYFGFLEEGEGEWEEIAGGNHTLEIGIGRLPVISLEEAQTAVDKIISYDSSEDAAGSWRSSLLFVADDEDGNLHHRQADRLAVLVDTTDRQYQNKRLFLGSFKQQTTGGGESSKGMTEALVRDIWKGALIVNYTGHGNVTSWAQEQIFTPSVINQLRNRERLPLFVTATCEFGRFDDPREISGAELLIKNPTGGGIGILSTCRPVFSSSNFNLNEAFYNTLADEDFKESARLGDLMRITKNNSVDLAIDSRKVGNRNFTLFGDPSMKLGIPQDRIRLTSIQSNGIETDTLSAGSRISIRGEVLNQPGFSGEVEIRLRDKAVELQTISAPVYKYLEKTNILFSGKAAVSEGKFEASFILPRNISNKPGNAQFYFYASSNNGSEYVSGTTLVSVSGISDILPPDLTGPQIEIFFGDSTNLSRSDVNDNTLVYVRLSDQSGINTSGFGVNNNIMADIDNGSRRIILNEFYQAAGNGSASGWVIFPLNDLSAGRHTLTFEAWDVFNNAGRATVEFLVADPGTLVVKELRNFPNPFRGKTRFTFNHNRSGEDLDITITIINRNGQTVKEINYFQPNSRGTVQTPDIEMENLSPGLYLYGVRIRSRLDGANDVVYQKMMLVN